MKSLFLRMFLWFCGGTLCGILIVATGWLLTNPDKLPFAWPRVGRGAVLSAARTAVDAYERGGPLELSHYLESFWRDTGIRAMLLDETGRLLGGNRIPPEMPADLQTEPDEHLKFHGRGHSGEVWLRGHSGASYAFVANIPKREGARFWPWLFFGSLMVSGSLLCYLLARHITAPVVHLRAATSRFSGGDLSARITMPGVLQRPDEIGGLARDFNQMAARIETLLTAQRRLVADVSHELGSPVTRLGLAVSLMRRRLDPESRAPLARMQRELERLNAMIAQLLMLSRLESLHHAPPMESIDLSALIQEVARDADFEATSVDRTVRLTECAACSLCGAPDLVRSAVENVVRNAVKYTEPKTQVSIRLERMNGDATVIVEDQGPGVPSEALDHMFEPFYRVDEARDRRTGGSGLGLAIAKQIVTLHGGTIRATNRPDTTGLEVRIVFPVDSTL
jgi:two-component system sensor histidine kinase CpxA